MPQQGGVPEIGHAGFFRRGLGDNLWPVIRGWLLRKA